MGEAAHPRASMRGERDRFVAFAFASADLLVELDSAQHICFVAGASDALVGKSPAQLAGLPLENIIAPEDRPEVRQLIRDMADQTRTDPAYIRVLGPGGKAPQVIMTGNCIPDLEDHFYLAMTVVGSDSERRRIIPPPKRDKATGLLEKDRFSEVAQARMQQGQDLGENYQLTFLDLSEFEGLRSQVDERVATALMSDIGDALREKSVGGDSAGRIEADKYGVVHRDSLDTRALSQSVEEIIRHASPGNAPVRVMADTVTLDEPDLDEQESARAVLYTINKFCEKQEGKFSIATLSDGCKAMLDETVREASKVKNIIAAGDYFLVYQPIVGLNDGAIHHYEALTRMMGQDKGTSPYHFITLAEDLGLIAEFDLAVCRRAIEVLEGGTNVKQGPSLAVNLSGRSLGTEGFIEELFRLLQRHNKIASRLLFEVTESSEITDLTGVNRMLQAVRKLGHEVCLDDFGAGAAAFEYLRSLMVDYVKIDGGYVRGAESSNYGRSFLRCISVLCSDLGVKTVGEMVENDESASLLRDVGVTYGQGWHFGKPSRVLAMSPPAPAVTEPAKMQRKLRQAIT